MQAEPIKPDTSKPEPTTTKTTTMQAAPIKPSRTFNANTVRVKTHGSNGPYNPKPAVNVKVRTSVTPDQWEELRGVARDCAEGPLSENVLARFGHDWLEERFALSKGGTLSSSERASQKLYDSWFSDASSDGFDKAKELACELFGSDVKVYSAGRSGGWLIVEGLPDVEEWSPVLEGETCPHCGKALGAEDGADQVCDAALDLCGCGERFAPFLPSLNGTTIEGARFDDGTILDLGAGLFERWAFFEEVCEALAQDTPFRAAYLIAANVFASEEASREVEFLRALDGGRWDTVRAQVPRKLEEEEAVGFIESNRPELFPDFAHVYVLRDPAPKVTAENIREARASAEMHTEAKRDGAE